MISLQAALQNDDLRKAVRIMNDIREAHETMHELSPAMLEAVCDTLHEMAQDRSGPRGALKQAWYEYAKQALKDARTRERKGVLGLYGGA